MNKCVYVLPVSRGEQFDQIMRWWSSKPQSVTARTLDYVIYCYVSSLALPTIIIPAVATKQVHPPTWTSPVSDLASLCATRGHLPTWVFLVSVPACQLPPRPHSTFRFQFRFLPCAHLPTALILPLASRESVRVA